MTGYLNSYCQPLQCCHISAMAAESHKMLVASQMDLLKRGGLLDLGFYSFKC